MYFAAFSHSARISFNYNRFRLFLASGISQADEVITLASHDETATLSSLTLIVSTGLFLASFFNCKNIQAKRKHHVDHSGNSILKKIIIFQH